MIVGEKERIAGQKAGMTGEELRHISGHTMLIKNIMAVKQF